MFINILHANCVCNHQSVVEFVVYQISFSYGLFLALSGMILWSLINRIIISIAVQACALGRAIYKRHLAQSLTHFASAKISIDRFKRSLLTALRVTITLATFTVDFQLEYILHSLHR